MAIFPLKGCMISLGSKWDKRGYFGVNLYQKDPKFVKKWLSYGHFLPERLRDSIGRQIVQKGILWCSFAPKSSKMGQEMAELWPFSPWKVAWFHWEAHGTKQDPLVFICSKNIQNRPKMAELLEFPPWEVAWFHWEADGTKGDLLVLICTKKIQIGQEMAELLPFSPWEVAWFHWESHGTKGDPFVFISTKRI